MIEADLLSAMSKRRPGRQDAVMEHQPVLYPLRGLPFQFPMPIGARDCPALGKAAGHIDVLARAGRGGRCLRVFEVKGPNALDVPQALNQAVTYCAALRFLLEESSRPELERCTRHLDFAKRLHVLHGWRPLRWSGTRRRTVDASARPQRRLSRAGFDSRHFLYNLAAGDSVHTH